MIFSRSRSWTWVLIPLLILVSSERAQAGKKVALALQHEPSTLNSMQDADADSGFFTGHLQEGLVRYSPKNDGSVLPGIAERWEQKGLTLVFHLRKNARWSDGQAITARDFVFPWRRIVDPKTGSALTVYLYPIKNAEKIAKGELPPEQLGVQAIGDHRLEVRLERPCQYFLSLAAYTAYYPVREDFFQSRGGKYASSAEDLLFSGPYRLAKWVRGASLKMVKNPSYWNAARIKIERIDVSHITTDANAHFNLFMTGETDFLGLGRLNLPRAQAAKLPLRPFLRAQVDYLVMNQRAGKAMRNLKLRKALAIAFKLKREQYLSVVSGTPGYIAAKGVMSNRIRGLKRPFLSEYPVDLPTGTLQDAKNLIQEVRAELGAAIPTLTFLAYDSTYGKREAEFVQAILEKDLGLAARIDFQNSKQQTAMLAEGKFDLASAGWSPDYADPLTYLEVMASWSPNNYGAWNHPEFDRLIRQSKEEADARLRMAMLGKAIGLMSKDIAVIPTVQMASVYTLKPGLEGVIFRDFGPHPDFTQADINSLPRTKSHPGSSAASHSR